MLTTWGTSDVPRLTWVGHLARMPTLYMHPTNVNTKINRKQLMQSTHQESREACTTWKL
jgi:hypothetical protein